MRPLIGRAAYPAVKNIAFVITALLKVLPFRQVGKSVSRKVAQSRFSCSLLETFGITEMKSNIRTVAEDEYVLDEGEFEGPTVIRDDLHSQVDFG
jgi:hypothetical protein